MKKFLTITFLILLMLATLTGCNTVKDSRTIADFILVYSNKGYEINTETKPLFASINATDGIIFYIDNSPVKIYQYADSKILEKAIKENNFMSDWHRNGLFLLETKNQTAIKIFNEVK